MTLSEFANIMHNYLYTENNQIDFLINLVNDFMEDPFTDADCEDAKNDRYNPLCYSKIGSDSQYDSSLIKIYEGSRNLPKRKVNKILAHADFNKFRDCLNDALSGDAIGNLKKELKKNFSEYDDKKDVGENCAFLFLSILESISKGTKTAKQCDVTDDANNLTNHGQNATLRFPTPAKLEICFCCKYWSGNRPESLDPYISIKGKCMAEYNDEVKYYTCKDSCDNFYPDQSAVSSYTRQDFIKSIGASDMLKLFKNK